MSEAEPTFSIRMLWPFVRLMAGNTRVDGPSLMKGLNLTAGDLVFDQRISVRATFQTLERMITLFEDPSLGLRAAQLTDQGMFGVVEHVAAASATLRAAIESVIRHYAVLSEGQELWLSVEGERACFRCSPLVPHPAAANDMILGAAILLVKRLCTEMIEPREVWLMHDRPSYADQYQAAWKCPVVFGKHVNAIWFDAKWLDHPMPGADPTMAAVYDRKAAAITATLHQTATLSRRVRERLQAQLAAGSVEMAGVARSLRLSTATLRRRLDAEGASFSNILDDVRKEAAERYLAGSELSVTEIAYRLGFSHVRAFGRAFRRWTGNSPTDFRSQDDS